MVKSITKGDADPKKMIAENMPKARFKTDDEYTSCFAEYLGVPTTSGVVQCIEKMVNDCADGHVSRYENETGLALDEKTREQLGFLFRSVIWENHAFELYSNLNELYGEKEARTILCNGITTGNTSPHVMTMYELASVGDAAKRAKLDAKDVKSYFARLNSFVMKYRTPSPEVYWIKMLGAYASLVKEFPDAWKTEMMMPVVGEKYAETLLNWMAPHCEKEVKALLKATREPETEAPSYRDGGRALDILRHYARETAQEKAVKCLRELWIQDSLNPATVLAVGGHTQKKGEIVFDDEFLSALAKTVKEKQWDHDTLSKYMAGVRNAKPGSDELQHLVSEEGMAQFQISKNMKKDTQ